MASPVVVPAALDYFRVQSDHHETLPEISLPARAPHHLIIHREAHLFATRPGLMEKMAKRREKIPLVTDQLLHVATPRDHIVRRGKLRVTEFMPDGREVTRAVLQAGAVLLTRTAEKRAADPQADRYLVEDLVLTALGEVELWALPAGSLELAEKPKAV